RRGHLHRGPFLHPALGLPDAHHQGQSGSAEARSGGDGDRRLRRLRAVRRERPRGDPVPVVLPGGGDPESESARSSAFQAEEYFRMNPDRPITILIAALGGEGGGVMADWLMEAATQCGYTAQATSIPGVAQRT